jgi:hypothetical protein
MRLADARPGPRPDALTLPQPPAFSEHVEVTATRVPMEAIDDTGSVSVERLRLDAGLRLNVTAERRAPESGLEWPPTADPGRPVAGRPCRMPLSARPSCPCAPPGGVSVTHRAFVVRNLDAGYTAFDVRPGQGLYLAAGERVPVW